MGRYLLLLVLPAIPYIVGINFDFVYDDHGILLENRFLEDPANLGRVLTLQTLNDPQVRDGRRPVVLACHFVDRFLWVKQPWGYHLTSLVLHLGAVLLTFEFLRRLAREEGCPERGDAFAFFAALLFGLHPILVEAVHMPSFRPDILYTLFTLLFLNCLLALRRPLLNGRTVLLGLCALAALALALGSKEAGIIGPVVVCAMWWCFPGSCPGKTFAFGAAAVCMGLVFVYLVACVGGQAYQAMSGSWNGISLRSPDNLYTATWLWVRYLLLLAWPHPAVVDRVIVPVPGFLSARFLVGIATALVTAWAILRWRRRRPWMAFALCWIVAGFLPVSNLAPLWNPMADRYFYFMVPGWTLLVAYVLFAPNTFIVRLTGIRARC